MKRYLMLCIYFKCHMNKKDKKSLKGKETSIELTKKGSGSSSVSSRTLMM